MSTLGKHILKQTLSRVTGSNLYKPLCMTSSFFSTSTKKSRKGGKQSVQIDEAELTKLQAASEFAVNTVRHTTYSNMREAEFAEYQNKHPGWTPYSNPIPATITVEEYVAKFADIPNGSRLPEEGAFTINGRINTRRESSSKLYFFDIVTTSGNVVQSSLQCILSERNIPETNFDLLPLLRKGDWISVTGFPGKSNTGELSVIVQQVTLLTPCLQLIPNTLLDPNTRFRQRHLDMLTNTAHTWDIFRIRTMIYKYLREYLNTRGFVEVETPILWPMAGGATARPFVTSSNAFGTDLPLNLRIAPELFLKQLVIGGMERVYEISKVFRNEGVDATHNPEFTSCEFYMAHANYKDLMTFTEDLMRTIVYQVLGTYTISLPTGVADPTKGASSKYHNPQDQTDATTTTTTTTSEPSTTTTTPTYIDFSKPFQRLDVLTTLKEQGIELPSNFNDPEAIPALMDICKQRGYEVSPPYTNARLLDLLIGEVIEPMCVQPTFIINHPIALSPLAKRHSEIPGVTERFELFIAKKEYCNAYSELNHPKDQYDRFVEQAKLRSADGHGKDVEAHPLDTPFVEALEYGLPPTGGWGLGIDRFVMLLARVPHIRDVIFFPIMKPQHSTTTDKPDTPQ